MLVSLADQHQIAFYESPDLINWTPTGVFGPLGDTQAVWECPDLFELPRMGSAERKWVLTLSAGSPHPGYIGMQYFIGNFDGRVFYGRPARLSPLPGLWEGLLCRYYVSEPAGYRSCLDDRLAEQSCFTPGICQRLPGVV